MLARFSTPVEVGNHSNVPNHPASSPNNPFRIPFTAHDRGDLNADKSPISATPDREQAWTLEVIGNWDQIASKTSGSTTGPSDTRGRNPVNEITGIDPHDSSSFNPDWDDGGSKSGNLYILQGRAPLN